MNYGGTSYTGVMQHIEHAKFSFSRSGQHVDGRPTTIFRYMKTHASRGRWL